MISSMQESLISHDATRMTMVHRYTISEAKKGRATSTMSKSSRRKQTKTWRANIVKTKRPDNKCQDKARIKALCPLNAYCTCAVRCVAREGERKGVSEEYAGTNPVSAIHVSYM